MSRMLFGWCVIAYAAGSSGASVIGPQLYTSTAHSPLNAIGPLVYLENFEDGLLNTPGVSASAGAVITGSPYVDSVDGDDGFVDGFGAGGHSWWAANGATGVVFTFAPIFGGQRPNWAGIVWTDGHNPVYFEAFDATGASLGVAMGNHADASYTGTTAEDSFYGAHSPSGISAIRVWSTTAGGLELDHLQYGLQVPGPGVLALLGVGACLWRIRLR